MGNFLNKYFVLSELHLSKVSSSVMLNFLLYCKEALWSIPLVKKLHYKLKVPYRNSKDLYFMQYTSHWEPVVGSVIQAVGMVEFKDGLRKGVLHGSFWCPFGDCIKPRI